MTQTPASAGFVLAVGCWVAGLALARTGCWGHRFYLHAISPGSPLLMLKENLKNLSVSFPAATVPDP